MNSDRRVAVAIVGYRNADDIIRCLAALEKSTYPNFEVVICENGGDAAYDALIRRLPEALPGGQPILLIQAFFNGGYAAGVNICLEQSKGFDAWWILNPDTEPSPDAMAALVAKASEGYDAVSGPIYFGTGEAQCFGGIWDSRNARAMVMGYRAPATTKPDVEKIEGTQNFLHGASMFVTGTFLEAAGPMDESYFLYYEEIHWFLKAAKRRKIRLGFAPDAVVIHHMGTTTGYTKNFRDRPGRIVWLDERNKMLLTRDLFPEQMLKAATLSLGPLRLDVRAPPGVQANPLRHSRMGSRAHG